MWVGTLSVRQEVSVVIIDLMSSWVTPEIDASRLIVFQNHILFLVSDSPVFQSSLHSWHLVGVLSRVVWMGCEIVCCVPNAVYV